MRQVKRGINFFLGILFILLGFLGLIIPVMPQIIFFAIGLVILSFEVPQIETYINQHLSKDSMVGKTYYNLRNKFHKYLG